MDSDDEFDRLVATQVMASCATPLQTAAGLASGSDDELDMLILEALEGVTTTTTPTREKPETRYHDTQQRTPSSAVPLQQQQQQPTVASMSVVSGASGKVVGAPVPAVARPSSVCSDNDSDGSGEAMLQAVLAGHGLPQLELVETHLSQGRGAKHPPLQGVAARTDAPAGAWENEEEDLVVEALANLAKPPVRFVSKSRRQEAGTPSQRPHKTAPAEAAITNTTTMSTTTTAVTGDRKNHKNGKNDAPIQAGTDEEKWARRTLSGEGSTSAPAASLDTRRPSSPVKDRHATHELEDEKHILSAILNALQDRQSSVSGDLAHEEDGYNVEAVLQHAEDVAASSLREERGKERHVMHFHEHIDMREEMRKARGSVGWPSCVAARATPVTASDESPPKSPVLSSSSLSKRPTLCIGTTLGIVLLFNAKRKMCGMCGSVATATVEARGAVVSLSMSSDALVVLSGHERGALVLWDTDALAALREVADEYSTPITRLRHCQMDPFRAVVLNSTGNVKLLSFTRILSKAVYRLTNIAASVAEAPFDDIDVAFLEGDGLYVVAAVSADTLLISVLDCGLQTIATPICRRTRPPKSSRTHELLRFASLPMGPGGVTLLMCVAWGADVEVFSIAASGKLTELQQLASVRLGRPLHAMAPIGGSSCLLLLDQNDSLHLLDGSAGAIVETREMHGTEPVLFSSRSCGMRYGAALAHCGNDVILLGRRRAFTCTLVSWNARLDALVQQRRFTEALELAKAFALEVALAVVGLSSDPAERRASIRAYMVGLITVCLSDAVETHISHEALANSVTSVIQFCAEVDAMDVFFGPAMACLRRATSSDTLALYCLEGCILSGAVTSLPEVYIQPFFDLLTDEALAEAPPEAGDVVALRGVLRAERALMRLDGSHELLLHIAEKQNLVQLTVSILSYRQHHYVDAFRFALDKSRNHATNNNGGDDVALRFFECTMRGETLLENVEIRDVHRRPAKEQLWSHLLTVTDDFAALLRIDPQRVLCAALLSLQEKGPFSPWDGIVSRARCVDELFVRLVGVELSCSSPIRPWELARRGWPPYAVVHELFADVTRLVLSGALALNHMQLFCEHVCSHFIYQFQIAEDDLQRRDVQNDVVALFRSSITTGVDFAFAEEELRQQRMARALAALHCARLEYAEAIDCYLGKENNRADADLAKDVFRVIREEMSRALHAGEAEAAQRLREAVMDRISLLVDVDATLLAQFVFDYLPGNHEDVMGILRNSSATFLRYLDELVAKGDPAVANDVKLQNTYIELLCAHDPGRVYPYLHSHDSVVTYDLHLALHAVKRYKVADAAVFLLEKTLMIDEAMRILIGAVAEKLHTLRQEVVNYVNSLCEKGVRPSLVSPFLSPMRKREEEVLLEGKQLQQQTTNPHGLWASEEALQQVLGVGIDLCTKYKDNGDSRVSGNWFSLLELFTISRRLLCDRQRQHSAILQSGTDPVDGFEDDEIQAALTSEGLLSSSRFPLLSNPLSFRGVAFLEHMIALYTKYVSHLLTHMIKVLDLSQVVGKIVEDHERERFGPFKPVIVDIMSSLSFELEVNHLCKLSMDNDIMTLGCDLHRSFNTGVVPLSDSCYICNGGLGDARGAATETTVRIYACGHGYHESCVTKYGVGMECVHCSKERTGNFHPFARPRGEDGSLENNNNNNYDGVGKRGEQHKMMQEGDIPLIVRRLKHTRAKIDGTRGYYELLRSFLHPDDTPTTAFGLLRESTGRSLLAPAPPPPINLGEFAVDLLNFDTALAVSLTDEEVLELFGAPQDGDDDNDNTSDGTDDHGGGGGEPVLGGVATLAFDTAPSGA
ncbi:hypothetical protein DQ04_05921010 [Trypanosoma grayi]|uniref:hypothetical protein n=1 Tax=Trypanosoma grayi TaxID=71804 RepID=UPI0004F40080|nr:hypothetical protein DQ04_05921010 [Trypanosoma grayi]KEG09046.1 hypothetical protein DQ04_05921010 [Trypanosoma grayi]